MKLFLKGLPLLDDTLNRPRESAMAGRKPRSSISSQRQKTSASIVTQKTTLPQMETITQRNHVYQVNIVFNIIFQSTC